MTKLTKNKKIALEKIEVGKNYTLDEATKLVKEISSAKFDASVDLNVRLGVDPRKSNQMVRGVVTLPHGTGKTLKVLALVTPDKEEEAKAAGADYVGLDEYVEKIKGGWTDIDVVITMPPVMAKVGQLGRILGPRGLMPNPKTGTVTMDVGKAVEEAKKIAATMLKNGPIALEKAIQAINIASTGIDFKVEASLFGDLCSTHDFKEGTSAFLEKRKPEFKGA